MWRAFVCENFKIVEKSLRHRKCKEREEGNLNFKMGDEFDGCECIWSPELAMQRLLNFIRQNQNECTDTHCIDVTGRLTQNTPSTTGGEDNNFTMMTMIMIFALIMYIIRPESIIKLTNTKRNARDPYDGNNGGSNQPPPSPPPAVN